MAKSKFVKEFESGNISQDDVEQIKQRNSKDSLTRLLSYYDKGYYIRFAETPKVSINVKQNWGTPFGTHAYILNSSLVVHYASYAKNFKYIQILSCYGNKLDCQKYTKSDFDKDLDKLSEHFEITPYIIKLTKENAYQKHPVSYLLFLTHLLPNSGKFAVGYNDSNGDIDDNDKATANLLSSALIRPQSETVRWSRVLVDILGYDYIVDNGGGFIHGNEPAQIVALSNGSKPPKIELVDLMENDGLIERLEHEISNKDSIIDDVEDKFNTIESLFERVEFYDLKKRITEKLFIKLFSKLTYQDLLTYGVKIAWLCESNKEIYNLVLNYTNTLSDEQVLLCCYIGDLDKSLIRNRLEQIAQKLSKSDVGEFSDESPSLNLPYSYNDSFDIRYDDVCFILDSYIKNSEIWQKKKLELGIV